MTADSFTVTFDPRAPGVSGVYFSVDGERGEYSVEPDGTLVTTIRTPAGKDAPLDRLSLLERVENAKLNEQLMEVRRAFDDAAAAVERLELALPSDGDRLDRIIALLERIERRLDDDAKRGA